MPKNGRTGAKAATTQELERNPALEFLMKEYDQLFQEIRNIHEKKIVLFKLFITYVIALLAYIVSGVVLYVRSKGAPVYPIPPTIAYGYSALGILLTSAVYSLVHNGFFYIGPSKKHTIRMWRAIHQIRRGIKKLFPHVAPFLMLPDGTESGQLRPKMSGRWELGALIFPMYHTTFFILLVLLLIPFFAPIDPVHGILISPTDTTTYIYPFVFVFPFLILRLALGNRAMKTFAACMQDARLITPENPYPNFRERHPEKPTWFVSLLNSLNVLFALFLWTRIYWRDLIPDIIIPPIDLVAMCLGSYFVQIGLLVWYLLFTEAIILRVKIGGPNFLKFQFEKSGQA